MRDNCLHFLLPILVLLHGHALACNADQAQAPPGAEAKIEAAQLVVSGRVKKIIKSPRIRWVSENHPDTYLILFEADHWTKGATARSIEILDLVRHGCDGRVTHLAKHGEAFTTRWRIYASRSRGYYWLSDAEPLR